MAGIGTEAVALDLADNPFYREYPDRLDTTAMANLQAHYRTHEDFDAALDSNANSETRRWRDGATSHPAPYIFRHIDTSSMRGYLTGIPFQTRAYAGKQASRMRESHSGAIKPAPAWVMEMNAMQLTADRKHLSVRNAHSETRRWRDGAAALECVYAFRLIVRHDAALYCRPDIEWVAVEAGNDALLGIAA
ncbi:MAG: hypothetical protein Q8L56_01370 [Rhodocyclaceae bacterium]|nr:hypothetical protein [Rhodocyclaceae bacterium]